MQRLSAPFSRALLQVAAQSGGEAAERRSFYRLMTLFAERSRPADPIGMFGEYDVLSQAFARAVDGGDWERAEEAFLALYCHVHGYEAPYSADERAVLDRVGGYWCHAGGISPLLKAGAHLTPASVSVDLGAGNGLQGLLLQKLYPHRCAIQIELSSGMVAAGKALQKWLDIPEAAVEWRVGDVRDFSPVGVDFIYLYRPMRPEGPGAAFYRRLADDLAGLSSRVTIFSIADCLVPFLSSPFEVFYTDGHLTCISNRPHRLSGV